MIEIDDLLNYLGPEAKEEVAAMVDEWLRGLHLLRVMTPDRIRLLRVDLHIVIDGRFNAKVIKTVDQ